MTHVIDSSVLLAHILGEAGGAELLVPDRLHHLSIVNLAEVFTKAVEFGGTIEDVEAVVASLPIRIRSFSDDHARTIALLRPDTKHRGLSFGDRACLALARAIRLPVLTADKKWDGLNIGIDIHQIR